MLQLKWWVVRSFTLNEHGVVIGLCDISDGVSSTRVCIGGWLLELVFLCITTTKTYSNLV